MDPPEQRLIELTRTDQQVELTVQGVRRVFVASPDQDPWEAALRYLHRMATVLAAPVRVRTHAPGGVVGALVVTPRGEFYDESAPRALQPVPGASRPADDTGWLPGGEAAVRRTPPVTTGAPSHRAPTRSASARVAVLLVATTVLVLAAAVVIVGTAAQESPSRAPGAQPLSAARSVAPSMPTAVASRLTVVPGASIAPRRGTRPGTGRRAPVPSASVPTSRLPTAAPPPPARAASSPVAEAPPRAPSPAPVATPSPPAAGTSRGQPADGPGKRRSKHQVVVPPTPVDPLGP